MIGLVPPRSRDGVFFLVFLGLSGSALPIFSNPVLEAVLRSLGLASSCSSVEVFRVDFLVGLSESCGATSGADSRTSVFASDRFRVGVFLLAFRGLSGSASVAFSEKAVPEDVSRSPDLAPGRRLEGVFFLTFRGLSGSTEGAFSDTLCLLTEDVSRLPRRRNRVGSGFATGSTGPVSTVAILAVSAVAELVSTLLPESWMDRCRGRDDSFPILVRLPLRIRVGVFGRLDSELFIESDTFRRNRVGVFGLSLSLDTRASELFPRLRLRSRRAAASWAGSETFSRLRPLDVARCLGGDMETDFVRSSRRLGGDCDTTLLLFGFVGVESRGEASSVGSGPISSAMRSKGVGDLEPTRRKNENGENDRSLYGDLEPELRPPADVSSRGGDCDLFGLRPPRGDFSRSAAASKILRTRVGVPSRDEGVFTFQAGGSTVNRCCSDGSRTLSSFSTLKWSTLSRSRLR